jgi:hypothetical protein
MTPSQCCVAFVLLRAENYFEKKVIHSSAFDVPDQDHRAEMFVWPDASRRHVIFAPTEGVTKLLVRSRKRFEILEIEWALAPKATRIRRAMGDL